MYKMNYVKQKLKYSELVELENLLEKDIKSLNEINGSLYDYKIREINMLIKLSKLNKCDRIDIYGTYLMEV